MAFAAAGAAAILAVWAWRHEGNAVPTTSEEPDANRVKPDGRVEPRAPPKTDAEVRPADAAQGFADLALRCDKFFHTVPEEDAIFRWPHAGLASDDCQAALEAWFPNKPAVAQIVPVAEPTTWGEVFTDVPQRLERVLRAMRDTGCQVAAGEIRADLAEPCAARDMALLAMWKEACGKTERITALTDSHYGFGLQEYVWQVRWAGYEEALGKLEAGGRLTGGLLNLERPSHVRAALDERLVDLAEHARERRRLDEVYLRTGWLRAKCEADSPTLRWMAARAQVFTGLMGRAAALGDGLALADRPLDRERALTLEKSDPLLAWLHLAVLDSDAAYAERDEAWDRARRELADRSPYFEDRRRLLELAGLECGEPCTRERLRAKETASRERLLEFGRQATKDCLDRDDCDLVNAIIALQEPLTDAELAPERREASSLIETRYRKRAESARMKYALAMEALAEATGREVDVQALRQEFADASLPWFLDDGEVELARVEADRLVAEALSRHDFGSAAGRTP